MARCAVPCVVLFALLGGYVVGQQPGAAPTTRPKRCVGLATSVLRQGPTITRVYRVFEDGSVETYDDGNPQAKWTELGQ